MILNSLTFISVCIFSLVFYSAPGWLLYRLYNPVTSRLENVMIGIPVGIGFSSLVFAVVGWTAGVDIYYFIFVELAIILLLWSAHKKYVGAGKVNIIQTANQDLSAIYFILIISIIIIISYTSFGKATPLGYLYKDLYATDLLHHMSVFIHLSKGIPPENPYFIGLSWHYYWLSHTFPAFIYALSGSSVEPKMIMLFTSLTYSAIFISALSLLLKQKFSERKVYLILMFMGLLAYGYNDIFIATKYLISHLPDSLVNQLYLDRLISEKGEQYTGYSHSWFRSFLVEPHSTLALSLLFITMLLVERDGKIQTGYRRVIFKGMLLGMVFSIDAFIGTISIIWYSLVLAAEMRNKDVQIGNLLKYLVAFSFPIITVFSLLIILEIIPIGTSTLVLKPYVKMILLSPLYYFIDYGPICVLSSYGIYLIIKQKATIEYYLLILSVVCIFFMFFVNLADIGSTQMFRKSGLVLRLPLIMLSGLSLNYMLKKNNYKIKPIIVAAILIAVPTAILDVYMLSDWRNTKSFLTYADNEASKWMKNSLPKNSVIQDYPSNITKIVAFGERRVALGDWEHAKSGGVKPNEIAARFGDIKIIFETEDVELSIALAKEFKIEYIYLTDDNRKKFKKGSLKFDIFYEKYQMVYSGNGVSIYKIIKS